MVEFMQVLEYVVFTNIKQSRLQYWSLKQLPFLAPKWSDQTKSNIYWIMSFNLPDKRNKEQWFQW